MALEGDAGALFGVCVDNRLAPIMRVRHLDNRVPLEADTLVGPHQAVELRMAIEVAPPSALLGPGRRVGMCSATATRGSDILEVG